MSLRHEEAGDGASSIAVTSTVAVGIGHEGSGNEALCDDESNLVMLEFCRGFGLYGARPCCGQGAWCTLGYVCW